MTKITHTVTLLNLNSIDSILTTLNSLPNTNASIIDKKITSIVISISIDCDVTFDDVLALGTLIGSIQSNNLI